MISIWIDKGWLTKQHFKTIQQFADSLVVPSDVGRIPSKIESGFSNFKADQFKSWILPLQHSIIYYQFSS